MPRQRLLQDRWRDKWVRQRKIFGCVYEWSQIWVIALWRRINYERKSHGFYQNKYISTARISLFTLYVRAISLRFNGKSWWSNWVEKLFSIWISTSNSQSRRKTARNDHGNQFWSWFGSQSNLKNRLYYCRLVIWHRRYWSSHIQYI